MVTLSCKKCGAKIKRLNKKTSISSKSFPIFMITKYEDYDGPPIRVDLCKRCSKDFDEWLEDSEDDFADLSYLNAD